MKKKVTIVVVILLVIVLIAACVMWKMGGVEAESALRDNQKYVYAYVSSIEGNEVTYTEVDESVAKAAEERAKEKAEAEDGAGSDSTGQGDNNDGGTDSAGQFLLCLPVYFHLKMVLGFVLRPFVLLSVCVDRMTRMALMADCKTQLYNQPCYRYVTVTSRFLRSLRCRQCLFLPIFSEDHLQQDVRRWS